MRRRLAFLLAMMMCVALAVCPAMAEDAQYKIGICQLVQHEALEEATRGFKAAVTERLGDQVSINEQNASGDLANCMSIVNGFLAEDVDLILANSTQALQAASAATGDTPILGVSVTDYPAVLDMVEWNGMTGVNVSGTSDLAPLDGQAELIREMFPDAKNVGLLYCSSEVNSGYQVKIISELLTAMGYTCTEYAFTDSNDVYSVTQKACQGSDVIFVPTDNTVASCTQVIRNVIEIEKVPLIGGDSAICAVCGVATISVNYYDLGYTTGLMACEILVDGADVSQMPIRFSPTFSKVVNTELCEYLGVKIPEGYQALE